MKVNKKETDVEVIILKDKVDLVPLKNRCVFNIIKYNKIITLNNINLKPKELSYVDYGRFFELLHIMGSGNKIVNLNNHKIPMKRSLLTKTMGFKNIGSLDNFINRLKKLKLLGRTPIDENNLSFYLINPVYSYKNNFILTKECFDLFKKDIINNIKYILPTIQTREVWDYIKMDIKNKLTESEFTEINHLFFKENYIVIDEITSLAGVYVLYNNNEIVYIGKSNNIKNRIVNHRADKKFDKVKSILFKDSGNINLYEPYLIQKYKPMYNKDLLDTITIKIPEIKL